MVDKVCAMRYITFNVILRCHLLYISDIISYLSFNFVRKSLRICNFISFDVVNEEYNTIRLPIQP